MGSEYKEGCMGQLESSPPKKFSNVQYVEYSAKKQKEKKKFNMLKPKRFSEALKMSIQ